MCEKFEVEWLKLLIKEQVSSMLIIGDVPSMLRCLLIAEENDIESLRSTLNSKLTKMSLIKMRESNEYQYLSYVARYKIAKYKIISIKSDNAYDLEMIFSVLDKIFIQKTEDLKITEEDPHDAHGPYPQIE